MIASDPSWFYSSLSQVTAAIVGFFGGFFILRLLGQMSEWRALRQRLDSLESAWLIRRNAADEKALGPVAAESRVESHRLWLELWVAIDEHMKAKMPLEFSMGAVLLGALLVVGAIWPLFALGGPSNRVQAMFLVPWVFILSLFGLLVYWLARAALKELNDFKYSGKTAETWLKLGKDISNKRKEDAQAGHEEIQRKRKEETKATQEQEK